MVLADGGIFVTYVGHLYLPAYIEAFGRCLNYRWQMASVWEGDANRVFPVDVTSQWKPVLIYSKGDWRKRGLWPDVIRSIFKEKRYHEWQQPISEVESLISYFSNYGDLVIDPCGGGGTTAPACFNLGRRCISCDIDEEAVRSGQKRLAKMRDESDK